MYVRFGRAFMSGCGLGVSPSGASRVPTLETSLRSFHSAGLLPVEVKAMVEESQPSSKNDIKMEATAYGQSKVTQIGHLQAGAVNISVEQIELVKLLEASIKAESVGIKAGDPPKSLAHWQGRDEEIAQLRQWLSSGITLICIEGIGGTGKSTLAAKIYEEIDRFPKRYWADVSTGAIFSELARQVLTEFRYQVPEDESQLVTALVKCLQLGQYLLVIDNLESLLQDDGQ